MNRTVERLGPKVEKTFGAETEDIIAIAGRARSDHACAGVVCELHAIRTDVPAGPVNEYRLTWFDLCVLEEHLPCGHADYRHRGSFEEIEIRRFAREHGSFAERDLCIGACERRICSSIHRVTNAKFTRVRTYRKHGPREIGSRNQRKVLTEAAFALANERVPCSDARRLDAYGYLTGRGRRRRYVLIAENRRRTEFMNDDCFHG